jgi:peptidoglycan/LPS O-acetylase OafA/YrhL
MVVAFHAGLPVPGGFVGVDVFFVISGFVITAILRREWHQTGRIRFGRFYLRRFKRLTPALALMVAVVVLISFVVLSPIGGQSTVARTALGAMLLSANFVISRYSGGYFGESAETNPLLNTWSLSVEEQFYLAFPALLALGWMLARRRGLLRLSPIAIVAGVALVSFGLAVAGSMGLTFHGSDIILGFYSPFTRAWEFAVGALLAVALATGTVNVPRVLSTSACGLLGAAMLAASLWLITDATPFPGPWTLLPVVGTLLLLLAGNDQQAASTRALSSKPMNKIGDWSYSIYLWHWPFIVFAGLIWPETPVLLVAAAVASMAPALASYHWVETPIRNSKASSRRRLAALVAVTVGVPVTLAGLLGMASRFDFWVASAASQRVAAFIEGHRPHEAWEDCLSTATTVGPSGTLNVWGSCVWGVEAPSMPLYLVGDSNSGMLAEALSRSAESLDSPLVMDSAAACPLVDWHLSGESSMTQIADICRGHVDETLSQLESAKPGVVVIANSDVYVRSDLYFAAGAPQGLTNDRAGKTAAWSEGLREVVNRLRSHGHKVLLVQPVHRYGYPYAWSPSTCTLFAIASGNCEASMPLDFLESLQRSTRTTIESLSDQSGVGVIDLRPYLCEGGACPTVRKDGMALYADPAHISVPASVGLTSQFLEAIQRVSQ